MQASESTTAQDSVDRPAPKFGAFDAVGLFTRGVAMGVADVIPGVSGGTIALISGIYERFIGALRSLSLRFVRPLLLGWPPGTSKSVVL